MSRPGSWEQAHCGKDPLFNAVTGLIFFAPLAGIIAAAITGSLLVGFIVLFVVLYLCIKNGKDNYDKSFF